MRAAVCVLFLGCLVAITLSKNVRRYQIRFHEYKTRFNKVYNSPEEEKSREEHYKKSVDRIDEINNAHDNNELSWYADVNHLSDKTEEERKKVNGYRPANSIRSKRTLQGYIDSSNNTWYYYTADSTTTVTQTNFNLSLSEPVLDQGQCGDCYAFASGSVVSSYYKLYKGLNIIVSRQDIAECSQVVGNAGCNGGDPRVTLVYVKNKQVASWSQYPYENTTYMSGIIGPCTTAERTPTLYTIPSFTQINPDKLSMKYALTKCSAIVTAIFVNDTTGFGFLFHYAGGIYDGTGVVNGTKVNECPAGSTVNHAVTIVGFGKDATTGVEYWIIKNSWSTGWGQKGYILFKMGICGIDTVAYTICPNGI